MIIRFFLTIITITSLICCNKNDINDNLIVCLENDDIKNCIKGTWHLTQINGGFNQPIIYNRNDITWNININNSIVTIKNEIDFHVGVTPEFVNNHSGTYNFTLEEDNNEYSFVVENRKGIIHFYEGKLIIDYGAALDDVQYTFQK